MATFVFVPGAAHGAWCWERVVPLMETQNHAAITPDLMGMGQDDTPLADVSRERWVKQISQLIEAQQEKVILIGHSRAGLIVSEVAESVPDRISTLVFLTALLLPNGSIPVETMMQAGAASGENPPLLVEGETAIVNPERVQDAFYNCTGHEWVERASSLLCPEPMEPYIKPLTLTSENFDQVPRVYIECLQDNALVIDTQRSMVEKVGVDKVFTLDTDHSPFYSTPQELTDILEHIASAV